MENLVNLPITSLWFVSLLKTNKAVIRSNRAVIRVKHKQAANKAVSIFGPQSFEQDKIV
jgi:hypothetical protein